MSKLVSFFEVSGVRILVPSIDSKFEFHYSEKDAKQEALSGAFCFPLTLSTYDI